MRAYAVYSEKELSEQVERAKSMGYKVDRDVNSKRRGRYVDLVKKKKISVGFCILWFILGVIPLFLYLIYCGARRPQDEVSLVMMDPSTKPQSATTSSAENPTTPTNPQ